MRWTYAAAAGTLVVMTTLYFSPLACSLATRIALLEAGVDAAFVQVDTKSNRLPDGTDYLPIHPLGLVPALRLDDGVTITENAAILGYLAECYPEALGGSSEPLARARLQQWLAFIATELHKGIFLPLLTHDAPDGAKTFALSKVDSRFGVLETLLGAQDFVTGRFSAADAYLFTVLQWSQVTPINLSRWPALTRYMSRVRARPIVKSAVRLEGELYARK